MLEQSFSHRCSEELDKMNEFLDYVCRQPVEKVEKDERTGAYVGRFLERFDTAAREGIELPDVARG